MRGEKLDIFRHEHNRLKKSENLRFQLQFYSVAVSLSLYLIVSLSCMKHFEHGIYGHFGSGPIL